MDKGLKEDNSKNLLEILATFEEGLQEKLQESKSEIERVKYYEKFRMQGIDFSNIFITEEKDVDGNISYHMYAGDSSKELLSINSKGELTIAPELEGFIKDLDLFKEIEENEKVPGRLKGYSEKISPEEMKKLLKDKEKDQNEEKKEEQIEQDLEQLDGEDLEITNYRQIKDNNVEEGLKENFRGAEEKGIGYNKKTNTFISIIKIDGKYQRTPGIEDAKPTMKTVISINEDGTEIEKKVPHALMKTNNPRKELSVTIGDYGYIETGTVDRLPCNERVERPLREDGEDMKGKRTKQVEDISEKGGPEAIHEIAHKYNETEELIEQEAGKAKVSVEEFKRYLEKADGDTLEEKIEQVHEEIEQDYGAPSRNRN